MKRIKTDLNFWRKQLGKGWADEVYPLLIKDANYLGSGMTYADYLISNIEADNSNNITMSEPSMGVIFKAFRLTPYGSLKVLVFGQDPDHNGLANGLAFGNIENDPKDPDYIPTAVSSNLRKIEEVVVDMYNDGDDDAFIPFDYTLESWAKQGVLLLNAALTIVGSQPNSRADLWKPFFSDQSENISELPKKPYLLISPARPMLFANHMKPFHEIIRLAEDSGELNRDPKSFEQLFNDMGIGYRLTYNFIEAIRYLAKQNNGYDIVLRPHPVENIETWKVYLKNIPNVHVIRKGSITPWLHNAFALIHNNCTTALEASVSGKPVITFLPFPQYYDKQIPNRLGLKAKTPEELLTHVNKIFNSIRSDKTKINEQIPDIVLNKINIDNNELSTLKIIKVWESLIEDKNLQFSKTINFNWNFGIVKFRYILKKIFNKLPQAIDKNHKTYWKFPPLNYSYIIEYVNKLQQILNISEKLECKFISDRTILIKKIKN